MIAGGITEGGNYEATIKAIRKGGEDLLKKHVHMEKVTLLRNSTEDALVRSTRV
ncbi:hypothetical protein N9O13_03980 [Crocinitomicaceae bacterium]|nr:hypothetical protein [Crocinitomicaceae bacterium]